MRVAPPRARTDNLVIEELDDELLVYDRNNKRAHCLSGSAARVWRACDGETDAEAISVALEMSIETVRKAIEELEHTDLLDSQGLEVLSSSNGNGITRRELTRKTAKVGTAVAAAPLILSITASPAGAAGATPTQFQCELYTTKDCGASVGCGSIAGCCCCSKGCPGEASCKGCSSVAACTGGNQNCANSPGNFALINCSDAKGTNPAQPGACCSYINPSGPTLGSVPTGCGCGWGPLAPVGATGVSTSGVGAGCCDITSTGTGASFVACSSSSPNTCVPCCGGKPIKAGSIFGCCQVGAGGADTCVH
jgi:hypothetical protein